MDEMQETEVTLSTGKLLAMFFGAAIICGIFFSFGYAVGKNSAPAAGVAIMDSSSLSTVSSTGGSKPAAARAAEPNTVALSCVGNEAGCVKQDEQAQASASGQSKSDQVAPELTANSADAQRLSSAAQPQAGAGFIVQVAAVSKSEDAEALKAALEKKQYPVFIVDNSASHLFHVQVGPFADQRDAEAMKSKLSADGYNAILKR